MTFIPVSENRLWELLSAKATLITVNRRLSRYLRRQYGVFQMENGRSVWESADILTLTGWLERSFANGLYQPDASADARMLLAPGEEQVIWEAVVSDFSSGSVLLDVPETAKNAREAWELCHAWRVPMEGDPWEAPDAAVFLSWAAQFEHRCDGNGWLSRALLSDYVRDALEAGEFAAPEIFVLAGFDEFSPRDGELLQALTQAGTRIHVVDFGTEKGAVQRVVLPDSDAEILTAARWARTCIELQPDRRIGVILKDLGQRRETVIRIFDNICHPESMLSANPPTERAYNISLGRSLSSYPVIRDALLILSLAQDRFSAKDWSGLLRSAFLAGAESEMDARALFDAKIRETGATGLSIARCRAMLAHQVKKTGTGVGAPIFLQILAQFAEALDALPTRQPPEAWARDFSRLLSVAGWPGEKTLSGEAFQAVSAWQDVMAGFAGLGRVSDDRTCAAALSALDRAVSETLFEPEQSDVPIQIMGVLEAAGERFDRIWIAGLHHGAWPGLPRPNPFLPMPLQRRMNLPHATPERELAYARSAFDRLLKSAPAVVVSRPASDGDMELSASPLIDDLPEFSVDALGLPEHSDYWADVMAASEMETLADPAGPEIAPGTKVGGGTGIMKSQAACPFQAFARYRLGARPLETPVSGLTAAERGTLVHLALQRLWESLVDQQTLVNLDDADVGAHVTAAVSAAVGYMAKKRPDTFTEMFTAIETRRLCDLLSEWLLLERERPPFCVETEEERREISIGGIRLDTVVDRIDRLPDGRRVIIDYKTGRTGIGDWLSPRITEPQLPLYSIAMDVPLAGIFFARVRKGEVRYLGVGAEAGIVPGVKAIADNGRQMAGYESLAGLIEEWRTRLVAIAEELRQGHAPVAPVSVNTSCRYCDLGLFCRIGMVPENEDDEADENGKADY